MALMSSQAPTFGQALGEAGTVGLDALGGARADYLERKQAADLMALRRAAAAGRGGRDGLTPSNLISIRDDIVQQIGSITENALGRPLSESALNEIQQLKQTLAGIDRVLGLNTYSDIGAATSGSGAPAVTRLPSAGV